MKKQFFLFAFVTISLFAGAQSPRTVLIEHFTNTRCSICASRNPGFYSVLANYPQVLHISYHPSAPYSQCYFSLQNPAENDGRTHYYSIYGSTPDFFLNGKLLPGANPAINNTTIDTALNKLSPTEVKATEELFATDSVKVKVVVKTTGVTSVSNVRLFTGVAEEPVYYNAANGETVHHDVFRKALSAVTGNPFILPALNDSISFDFTYEIKSGWNASNIYTLALVQREDTKEVLNAAKSLRLVSTAIEETNRDDFSVYPNPFREKLTVDSWLLPIEQLIQVFDVAGRKAYESPISAERVVIKTADWNTGVYFLKVGNRARRIVKE